MQCFSEHALRAGMLTENFLNEAADCDRLFVVRPASS